VSSGVPAKLNIRRAAHAALHAWGKGHDYAETLVERHAQRHQLSSADRHLLHAILFGVLRHRRVLDHWISKLRHGKLDPEARDLLRIGLYQILLLQIADHAAVNETVEAGKANIRGLVNAVLRRAIDSKKRLLEGVDDLPLPEKYSHPDWLFKRWRKHFGADAAQEIMEGNQMPPPTYARYNPLSGKPIPEFPPVDGTPGFYLVEGSLPSDLLRDGVVYIQDPATRHAVEMLAPLPGETILDACAAPGGKAAMIAAAMNNEGSLVATDSNEKRLPRLQENLQRLHITCAEVSQHDWLEPAPTEWHGKFDAILLDVPCSNSGVLRRRIDARWRLHPTDLQKLPEMQARILANAVPCLRDGGRLVYSTCSIEPEENGMLVKAFADLHSLSVLREKQILPTLEISDGAYCALLQKKAP